MTWTTIKRTTHTSRPALDKEGGSAWTLILEGRESMTTIPETVSTSKPKAYYCTFRGLSGILTRPAATVLFLEPESGAVVSLSPEEVLREVVVNGEVATAMAQYVVDLAQGGYAARSCQRRQEVG
jgi:hypothetical protein